jgi:haloacetate dehalogenase
MGEESYADYRRAIHNPDTVHAMCEDYRAGLGIDRAHDEAKRRDGKRIACATLVAWAAHDDMEDLYGDPLEPWRAWAEDVAGRTHRQRPPDGRRGACRARPRAACLSALKQS